MKIRWFAALAFACASALSLVAQAPAATGIAHVAYRTGNAEAETAFFAKLGYEQAFSFTNKQGQVSQIFVKINDRQFIEIYTLPDAKQSLGWQHVCYESTDLSGYAEALVARGLQSGTVHKAGAGNLITAFNDPDGRTTEFTQYMPGSRHTLDQGQHLGSHRISEAIEGIAFATPDLAAARTFYQQMGFKIAAQGQGLHIQITEKPAPWIDLSPAGAKSALYLAVPSLKAAETQLRAAGLKPTREKKSISVTDPDGNLFFFVER
jgi:catechol 2,3-dioxygenase-like lactoylglutathione lyase family enzyme